MRKYLSVSVVLLTCLLSSCVTVNLNPDAEQVEVAAEPLRLANCQYLGEVTGSKGHWYTYLFLSNRTMVQEAVNDLRNRTAQLGGDTVFIRENTQFSTSVTLLGLAYRCKK